MLTEGGVAQCDCLLKALIGSHPIFQAFSECLCQLPLSQGMTILSPSSHAAERFAVLLQGKNPAVNRVATVVVPCMIGAGALVMLFNGCHKLYTGTGKME